jgi:protocatechuate 3,4-dioxygenase beta subunit
MHSNKIIIPYCDLYCKKVSNYKIYLESSNSTLIDGTVLDPDGNPVINAGIEIIQVMIASNLEKTIGCVFTDSYGRYAFTLNMDSRYYYKFKLYSKI